MQPGVTPMIKERVIESWFRGLKRDNIANEQGIATGTVTNIIREWVADFKLGDIADAMRYFAVTFRKLKLTIPQCVLGARNVSMMNNLGIEENDFEEFISKTYKFLKELGVDPKKMAYTVKQMEELAGTMTIAQIPQYISELEQKKKQLSEDIEKLRVNELDMQTRVELLKNKAKDLGEEFQLFAGSISELKKYGLKIEDVESFAETVKEAHDLGYDGHLIGSKLRYWNGLKEQEMALLESIAKLKLRKERLENRTGYYEAR
jgi:hypothetical protein